MTRAEFHKFIDKIWKDAKKEMISKGQDYTDDKTSAFLNFKEVANDVGITKYQVWAVYMAKHVRVILSAIKRNPANPQTTAEKLDSRLEDSINYFLLLRGMLEEDSE